MSVNKVILVGNIGKNPEIRSTNDGREIANFSLATSESWKDKSTGERKEKTEWHNIVVFSQGLVGVIKTGMKDHWIKKGTKLYIEGQIQTRKWTDKQGAEKYSTEIILNDFNSTMQVLSNQQGDNNSAAEQKPRVAKVVDPYVEPDDDIPF